MDDTASSDPTRWRATTARTPWLFAGLVILVAMIAAPSFVGRIQYARTRAELAAIRDAAGRAELAPVGKLFTTLAKLTGPAVVKVEASFDLAELADEIRSLRGVLPGGLSTQTIGSGVIIDTDGVIVTNYHVVAQAERIAVQLADGRRFEAELAGADAATDLAVLRIDASQLPAAPWGDSDTIEPGEMVWAVGNPFGLGRTITYGIISGVGRRGVSADPFQEFLQTDASINPGNSGGPLVDVHGHIVGITTAIVGRAYRGIGFAIPSNDARRVCEEILRTGHVERGYLGVALRDAPSGRHGAIVTAVEPRSPAALAGIRPGDLVTNFDGLAVSEASLLVLLVTRSRIGQSVELGIDRASEESPGEPDAAVEQSLTVSVRIGRRPADE
jgi:S1-C subfamily serine protease